MKHQNGNVTFTFTPNELEKVVMSLHITAHTLESANCSEDVPYIKYFRTLANRLIIQQECNPGNFPYPPQPKESN